MNKNLLRRRQLLSYFGMGALLASTKPVLDLAFIRTDSSTSSSIKLSKSFSASAAAAQPETQVLPEFQGLEQWLNSTPLTIHKLKGKVVLIHFWTFGCINCQRTLPYVVGWHRQFAAKGLKVIGVHTPEFAFERDVNNVKKALKQHQISYPVALDNEYKTWKTYENQYWPHLFLADRQGFLRYDHIGEGAYQQTQQTIRDLLG